MIDIPEAVRTLFEVVCFAGLAFLLGVAYLLYFTPREDEENDPHDDD